MSEKHILVQGGLVYCSQSVACNSPATGVPITVTSQMLVDANGGKLVATEKDNAVANMNFMLCNDPKYRTPPPCMTNATWSKMFDGVLVGSMGLKILTEESEAICNTCSIPGQIKVGFHGQQAAPTAEDMQEAEPEVMENLNPMSRPFERNEDQLELTIKEIYSTPETATIEQINSTKIR